MKPEVRANVLGWVGGVLVMFFFFGGADPGEWPVLLFTAGGAAFWALAIRYAFSPEVTARLRRREERKRAGDLLRYGRNYGDEDD